MDTCLNCNGAILEPGISYGWGGPVCYCVRKDVAQYQRPASKERQQTIGCQNCHELKAKLEKAREALTAIVTTNKLSSMANPHQSHMGMLASQALKEI